MRDDIRDMIAAIKPFDSTESAHIQDALDWIKSGVEIFRIEKPETPPKHLVSYFVVVDPQYKKIMLVDHIKAELLLPAGGHVDLNEDPRETVRREIKEELEIEANFLFDSPIFLTETVTVGKTAGHTDVSLWFVVQADSRKDLVYDPNEFNGYKWFSYEEILDTPIQEFDPHMHRFTKKLLSYLK